MNGHNNALQSGRKELKIKKVEIEGLKKEWEEAVDAYHRTPADAVIDLSKITGYTEAVAGIKDFNKAIEDFQNSWNDFNKAMENYNTVWSDFDMNKGNIQGSTTKRLISWIHGQKLKKMLMPKERMQTAYDALANDPNADAIKKQEDLDALVNFNWNEFYNESYKELVKPLEEKRDAALKAEDTKRIEAETTFRTAADTYKTKRTALDTQVGVVTPLYEVFYNKASVKIDNWNTYRAVMNINFGSMAGTEYYSTNAYIYSWSDEDGNYHAQERIPYTMYYSSTTVDTDAVTEIDRDEIRILISYRSKPCSAMLMAWTLIHMAILMHACLI